MEPRTDGAPAWAVAWGATLLASVSAALAVGVAAVGTMRTTLDDALSDQLAAQAGVVAASVAPLSLDAAIDVGGERSLSQLEQRLAELRDGAGLHDVLLARPERDVALSARGWVALQADADLVATAASGTPTEGLQYRSTADQALYRTAYAPVPGRPGWVVGVEGSNSTLAAVDELTRRQVLAGSAALLVAAALAGLAAAATTRPLHRLELDLSGATPADADTIVVSGPREVRSVARTARSLLTGLRVRDLALAEAHARRMRDMEALAATVAHEVRNPLHALGMTLDRVDTDDPEKRGRLLGRARARLDEMEGIIQRFLDVSRPVVPTLAPVDLALLLRELSQESEGATTVVTGEAPTVDTDADLLRQILRNLVRNAREAGATTVTVAVSSHTPVTIDVLDDGPGVPPDLDLFGWFATGRELGTGLGLPWSRKLARAMGGDLDLIDHHPTRFRIVLRGGPVQELT
ncbi:MAG: HAMP domain-containing histidine kinase [Myxococcales bacterium]|nr:HAMP domain-containing histidine kinase [Myxococcales bacterium]